MFALAGEPLERYVYAVIGLGLEQAASVGSDGESFSRCVWVN